MESMEVDTTARTSHPLSCSWSFYYLKKMHMSHTTTESAEYESAIEKICSFSTVEEFWAFYSHLIHPGDQPIMCNYHLFRDDIKPMWEDERNKNGGRYSIRVFRKLNTNRYFEELLFALVGDYFDMDDEICGIYVSVRENEDFVSIWNKTADDLEIKKKLKIRIKQILGLSEQCKVVYKAHNQNMRDAIARVSTEETKKVDADKNNVLPPTAEACTNNN